MCGGALGALVSGDGTVTRMASARTVVSSVSCRVLPTLAHTPLFCTLTDFVCAHATPPPLPPQTEAQLDCALDLMRRLPPQNIEENLAGLIDLVRMARGGAPFPPPSAFPQLHHSLNVQCECRSHSAVLT
jgi:hypothetical protein